MSDSLQDSIETIDITPSIASDHSAIILKLCPTYEGNQGSSYWKEHVQLRFGQGSAAGEVQRAEFAVPCDMQKSHVALAGLNH